MILSQLTHSFVTQLTHFKTSHFKALQSILMITTPLSTNNDEIMPQTATCEGCRVVNTLRQVNGINALRLAFVKKRELCVRYKVRQEAFDVLVAIADKWITGFTPSTVFSLSIRADRGDITAIHYKVYNLVDRGLIEHVGFGRAMSKTYAPTKLGLSVIDELFPV